MTLNILFHGFCLVALVGLDQKCDAKVINDATSTLEIFIEHWFPPDIEFNECCVAEGCPALKKLSFCPCDLNIDALRNIIKTISVCMSGPICGIVMEPRPIKSTKSSLDQLLTGLNVSEIVTFVHGTGYLSNIFDTQLDTTSDTNQHLPLLLTMLIPNMRFHGRHQMDFRIKTDFCPDLTARLSESTYDLGIQFVSIVSINHTGLSLDIKFVNPIIMASLQVCGIDLPSRFPNIRSMLTASMRTLYGNSTMATAMGRVLGNYIKVPFRSLLKIVNS